MYKQHTLLIFVRPWTLPNPPGWILDQNIEVNKKSKKHVNNNAHRESNRPMSKGTSGTGTARPQSLLFVQSAHHSTENKVP